jgi:hypothetical protein
MEKPKQTFADHIKNYFTPTLLIGAVIAGALFWGRFETSMREITFDNSKQKLKVVEHTDEVPNAVENYKMAQELVKSVNIVDSTFKLQKAMTKEGIKNSKDAIESRAKRDSLLFEDAKIRNKMLNELERIDLRTRLNSVTLDSIKKNQQ